MAPTRRDEEIEGRSYKDYAYSPVPVSSSSAVFDNTTPGKESVKLNTVNDKEPRCRCRISENHRAEAMTEKGSTLVQYLAAAAGESVPPRRRVESPMKYRGFGLRRARRALTRWFTETRPPRRSSGSCQIFSQKVLYGRDILCRLYDA